MSAWFAIVYLMEDTCDYDYDNVYILFCYLKFQ